ncbi:PAS domain-containing protein [Hymenobacter sp. BT683]|uniref:histidine kinase n=1 Tax=Hymenobacter jeongseonensis TaxID=2791027 RepID=A0ABS0IP25_9BACT|nr:PAS domain-containing sensor histidine kinase [Hymenobacter jeongseonensis]MBF9239648.1 PAS domain-containing protein [Hymenobacter jeongseonensis]
MTSSPSVRPVPPAADLQALLEVSLTALALWRPCYGPDGATVTDFACEYLNPAGQQLLGQPEQPEETFAALFPNARESGLLAFCGRVFATDEPGQFEVILALDDLAISYHVAARRQGERLATSFTDIAGEPCTAVALALHASRAAETVARADAERQRATLARYLGRTHAAICVLRGPTHALDYCNPTFERLFSGRPLPPGTPLAEVLPAGVKQGLAARLRRVYRTGTSYFGVERPVALEPAGDQPVRTHYFTFSFDAYQEDGRTAGVSIFAYDVTEAVSARSRAETLQAEVLAATRQQLAERDTFHEVFEQTPALVALVRQPGHRFEYVNPAYQSLFPGRLLVGHDLTNALPELRAQGFIDLLDRVYQTGETYFGAELPFVATPADGLLAHQEYFNFTLQAFREAGYIAGISIFAFNVTEQVLARNEREAQRQQLQEANRALTESNDQLLRTNVDLDTFIYTASHDLKTPITNLEGLLHALREELPAALLKANAVPPLLDRMQGAMDRFQLTLAQLTDFTKLQRANIQPAESVDLATLVADIRLDLAQLLTTTDAQLTIDVASCPRVSFAPKNLRSILYNLLSNAVKYRSPDRPPRVELRCRSAENGTVVLDVHDNGLGLTEAQQSKLFGLFQRLHTHGEGTGIGLFMVKRIVENAGGTISVQSTPDVGTTFTITLPALAVAEPPSAL